MRVNAPQRAGELALLPAHSVRQLTSGSESWNPIRAARFGEVFFEKRPAKAERATEINLLKFTLEKDASGQTKAALQVNPRAGAGSVRLM